MRTFKNITAIVIVMLTAIFCLAQYSPKKPVPVCKKYEQAAVVNSITDVEDFSLISLLTLRFM